MNYTENQRVYFDNGYFNGSGVIRGEAESDQGQAFIVEPDNKAICQPLTCIKVLAIHIRGTD